jgi:uncharacterized protein
MDGVLVGVAMCGLVVAGIVKGATGLGYATCALPFLVPAVGLPSAMAVVLAPTIATNLGVALTTGHLWETCRRFYPFYVATLPGIGCGVIALTFIDPAVACRVLGASVILYVAFALAKPNLSLAARLASVLQVPAGFANGVVTGLTGSQVMPLLPFMMSLDMEPSRLVQAVNLSVLISSLVLAATMALSGAADVRWLGISMAAVVPALAGVRLGNYLRQFIPPELFRQMVLGVLLIAGVVLIGR